MKITITGKDFALTEGLTNSVKNKLKKIDRIVGDDTIVDVKLSAKGKYKEHYVVELTVKFKKSIVRAEVSNIDMYKAIGDAVDTVTSRIIRLKGKMKNKAGEKSIRENIDNNVKYEDVKADRSTELEDKIKDIVREKEIKIELMTREEACIEMEYTDHDFYVFKDIERDDVLSLMYRRNSGGYGVIMVNN